MKRGSKFNFKRIYPYICKGCNKRRGTRIYERRLVGFCTLCKKLKVDKNQLTLTPQFSRVRSIGKVIKKKPGVIKKCIKLIRKGKKVREEDKSGLPKNRKGTTLDIYHGSE